MSKLSKKENKELWDTMKKLKSITKQIDNTPADDKTKISELEKILIQDTMDLQLIRERKSKESQQLNQAGWNKSGERPNGKFLNSLKSSSAARIPVKVQRENGVVENTQEGVRNAVKENYRQQFTYRETKSSVEEITYYLTHEF